MKHSRIAAGSIVVATIAFAACSDDAEIAPPQRDAGSDTASPPPPPPPPPADASSPDAARPEVRPASRLPVTCEQAPCYLAVSGNGGEHVCGLLDDGTVRCWGRDTRTRLDTTPDGGGPETDGALGRGRVVSSVEGATPAPVVGLTGVKQISVGPNLGTCALTADGAVVCWGRNEFAQLGRPSSEPRITSPARIEGLPPASVIALGAATGCAIASGDGALWCWGARNTRFGIAATSGDTLTFPPQRIDVFRPPVHEIAIATIPRDSRTAYQDTVAALLDDGVLASLGEVPAGESSVKTPISPLPIEVTGVVRIGAFGYLSSDGLLRSWIPDDGNLYIPQPATAVDLAISAGRANVTGAANRAYVEQAGVVLSSGRLFRWGRNAAGALGAPPAELDVALHPLDMTHVAGDRVVTFATTLASTCVSSADGKVKCWGTNLRGELGRGTVDAQPHPEAEVIR